MPALGNQLGLPYHTWHRFYPSTFSSSYSIFLQNCFLKGGNTSLFDFSDTLTDKPFTINFYAKIANTSSQRLFVKSTSGSGFASRHISINITSGLLTIRIWGGGRIEARLTADPSWVNNWVMYTFTYDGSRLHTGIKIYINGVLSGATTHTVGSFSGLNAGVGPIAFGEEIGNATTNHYIDTFSVFSQEFSAAQVTSLFNSGVPVNPSIYASLIDWFSFDNIYTSSVTSYVLTPFGGSGGVVPVFSTDVP